MTRGGVRWVTADEAMGVAVDATVAEGDCYVCGRFSSPTSTFGSTRLRNAGGYDAFVVRVAAAGSVLWGVSVGGVDDDEATAVALDAQVPPSPSA